jgi:hypothetical protein
MRPLLTVALAVSLMGCSFAPQRTQQASLAGCSEATGLACSKRAASRVLHSEVFVTKKAEVRHRRKANADTKSANSDVVPKIDALSSVRPDNNITTSAIVAKPETQASQFDDQSDPVIKKAKATIAAKMGGPASVEFVEIKRAAGPNAISNSSDIVCGFVREKNGVPRPFLYLVPKDEAYIGGYNIVTSAYRHICSITL